MSNYEIEQQTGETGAISRIINILEAGKYYTEEEQIEVTAELLKKEKDLTSEELDEVLTRVSIFCVLSNASRKLKDSFSWGDECLRDEKEKDEKYVVMSDKEWWNTKEEAKRKHWFNSWEDWKDWKDRVHRRRDERKAKPVVSIPREKDLIANLLDERRDIMRYPAYMGSEETYHQTIQDIEATVRSLPGGKWRLEMEYQRERPVLQIRINEVVNQVKALYSLKKTIAACKIQNAWRSYSYPVSK